MGQFGHMRTLRLRRCHNQVNGKSNASNSIYLRDIRTRIFGCAILRRLIREVARAVSTSTPHCGVIVVGAGSGKVRALVLNDLLKYIVQDGLGVIWILNVLRDTQYITTLADVVLDIFIIAFVGELSHFNLFGGKLFVEVEQVEARRGQIFDTGQKDSGLQLRHGRFKLWWNKGERLMLYPKGFEEFN